MPDTVTITKEQLDALVKDGVDRAMQKHTSDMAALRQNRDDILNEKKRLEGKTNFPSDFDAWSRNIDRKLSGKDPSTGLPDGRRAYTLTREEARDPQRYRAAKEAAEKAGAEVRITEANDGIYWSAKREGAQTSQVIRTDRAVYVPAEACRDMQYYRRIKAEAAAAGKPVHSFQDRVGLASVSDGDADALAQFDGEGAK